MSKRIPHKRSFLDTPLEEGSGFEYTYDSRDLERIPNPALVTTIHGKFRWRHFPAKSSDQKVFNTREEALRNKP